MSDIGNTLQSKMGPFPVWVWGVLLGGAFVAFYWFSNRGSVTTDETTTDTVATPSGDFSTVPVLPSGDGGVQDESTNAEWLMQAVQAVANAGVSSVTAQTALMKYLNGDPLTASETQIVDRALSKVGLPPEGVMGTPQPTTPTTPEASNATTTTINAPTTRKIGQSATIRVTTKWNVQSGHTGQPTGTATFYVDGKKSATVPLINGQAVYIGTPQRGWDSTKDKKWVITARFNPMPGSKAAKSEASPHVITLTTT